MAHLTAYRKTFFRPFNESDSRMKASFNFSNRYTEQRGALTLGLILVLVASCFQSPLIAADTNEEQQLIGVLQSNSSLQQKDAACARLKHIGTARSVPALALLLTDENLSHSARYALESMPAAEAGAALIMALTKTSGLLQVGLINSLGFRRETAAVPSLEQLLRDPEAASAMAAAVALGRIGALKSLQAAFPSAKAPVRAAIVDGLLRCANQLLADEQHEAAAGVFRQLAVAREPDRIRTAAYRGLIRSAGDGALPLVISGIQSVDGAIQTAALQMARELEGPDATPAIVELLPNVSPGVQIALIGVLQQRGDPSAAPAVLTLARSKEAAVRVAALTALGRLGDASAVELLANATVAGSDEAQAAARQTLLEVRRGAVTEALVGQLASAQPAVQVEVVKALAGRAEKSTVPKLLELARSGSASASKASFRALALLSGAEHVNALVELLSDAQTEAVRTQAQEALGTVCQRLQERGTAVDVNAIVQRLFAGPLAARMALLPVCSVLVDSQVRSALRRAVGDANPDFRDQAIRALAATHDAKLLPDLIQVTKTTASLNLRTVAMRGCVRLVNNPANPGLSTEQRISTLQNMLALSSRPEEKRLVLAGFATITSSTALQLVLPLLDEADIKNEAAQAVIQIAGGLLGVHAELARTALKKVLAVTSNSDLRQAAEAKLQQIEAMASFITAWQVAGPYRQDGKNYAALFDTVFPPEAPTTGNVEWRSLPAGTNPAQPWLLDLLKALGGEQCVAYVRTSIRADKQQPARLELGTDDGVKVWLNGQLVHANNTARPVTVGSDKVKVSLHEGWNTLLLKITQNNQGWEYCARLVTPDGARLEGLQVDATRTK